MKWKVAAICAIALSGLLLILLVVRGSVARRFNPASVIVQIRPLKQLTTVRYSIQRVVGITEAKQPFGEESLLLMVQGEVLAGVDLSQLKADDVSYLDDHTISVHLPEAGIFQSYLEEKNTKVWDRHITWWTPWVPFDPDLEHKARIQALDEVRKAALSMGILDQARKNAETAIGDLLSALKLDARFNGPS